MTQCKTNILISLFFSRFLVPVSKQILICNNLPLPKIRGTRKVWGATCLSQYCLMLLLPLSYACKMLRLCSFPSRRCWDLAQSKGDQSYTKLRSIMLVSLSPICIMVIREGSDAPWDTISCVWWQALLISPKLLQQLTWPLQSVSLKFSEHQWGNKPHFLWRTH